MGDVVKMTEAQKYIQISRYSRWNDELNRREIWPEPVDRYFSFMKKRFDGSVPKAVWEKSYEMVKDLNTMPSMRSLWAAGPALEKNNIIGYNCCYLPIVDYRAFAEVFYILMCGTGVGFSVERQFISKVPAVQKWTNIHDGTHIVGDSREGWAEAFLLGIETWAKGHDVEFDFSQVRPRGARLKTMGGRASGPDPLRDLLKSVRFMMLNAQGRQLTDLECHDICTQIGDAVVVGGIRRAAEISFSDLDSATMRHAKDFPVVAHRQNANNSAVYAQKPTMVQFMEEWAALAKSGTGERGIFNLSAVKNHLPNRRQFRDGMRTNPCGEILLRPFQFCNLSEVVVRAGDEFDDLIQKVEVAVWLGAMQATLTDFPFIRKEFKINCEEERLLGVSLTGQMDNPKLLTADRLSDLRKYAIKVARRASKALGINLSAAITTGKPSGTVSKLVNASSGAHPRHSQYQIMRFRNSANDPLFHMMKDQGMKFYPENGQEKLPEEKVMTWVCEFPVKAPAGAVTRDDMTAIEQLEWYLRVQHSWCEHNQSISIYVRDDEWLKVGAWVYDHFDDIVGVSFFPYDNGKYRMAPNEAITKEEYERMVKVTPVIDYSQLSKYEVEDMTNGAKEVACTSGACEIDFGTAVNV